MTDAHLNLLTQYGESICIYRTERNLLLQAFECPTSLFHNLLPLSCEPLNRYLKTHILRTKIIIAFSGGGVCKVINERISQGMHDVHDRAIMENLLGLFSHTVSNA